MSAPAASAPRARRRGALAVVAGVGVLAAHAGLAPLLVAWTARPGLRVVADGPRVVEDPGAAGPGGHLLDGASAREEDDGVAPGLVRHRWFTRYRGGVERGVGRVRLLGPFQDVAAPPCGGRLVVGQALLDDGKAGPGTVAEVVARELTAALRTVDVLAAGDFEKVTSLELRWASFVAHPFDASLFPEGTLRSPVPTGYLRIAAIAQFQWVDVPIVVGVVPRLDGGQLAFTVGLRARLDFGNRVLDWVKDRVGGDAIVTRMASGQLDTSLLAALGPPPPLELPDGHTIAIEPCPGRAVEIVEGSHAAVPLRWRLGGPVGDERIRPPAHGPIAWPPPAADRPITLDLDLDGLDGLGYELWRAGYLDQLLDGLDLAGRFNDDPLVQRMLSLRLSPVRLTLPPTLAPAPGDRLRLSLALAVDLGDGELVTPATAWGSFDVGLGAKPAAGDRTSAIAADVALRGLDLTCEPSPGLLVPCYGNVLSAVRGASTDVHATMAEALGGALTELFVDRRLDAGGAPAALAITGARARTITVGSSAMARVELDAHLVPPP